MSQTLREMEDCAFLAKVDSLVEHFERQTGEDPLDGWTLSSFKDEIRRRVLEKPISEKAVALPVPIVLTEVKYDGSAVEPVMPIGEFSDDKLVELLRNSSKQVFRVLSYKTGDLWEELVKRLEKNKLPTATKSGT